VVKIREENFGVVRPIWAEKILQRIKEIEEEEGNVQSIS